MAKERKRAAKWLKTKKRFSARGALCVEQEEEEEEDDEEQGGEQKGKKWIAKSQTATPFQRKRRSSFFLVRPKQQTTHGHILLRTHSHTFE